MNTISVTDFVNTDLRDYSKYDCDRMIPHLMDGMKITQRKIIKTMLNGRENAKEIKVAQLASYVAAETDYHHGEAGIGSVIVNLAKDYAGSNNYALLTKNGQFGSRLNPEPSATRYIFTQLHKNFRKFFNKEDDEIVRRQYSDGMEIEPEFFYSMVPMSLLNGGSGIGTGFSSDIQPRKLDEIIEATIRAVEGKDSMRIKPWYRGFKGEVDSGNKEGQWTIRGDGNVLNATTIRITELPIGVTQAKYKEFLVSLMENNTIKGFDDDSSLKSGFLFTIQCTKDFVSSFKKKEQLLKTFKLISNVSENFVLWTPSGYLKTFNTELEVIQEFVKWRLPAIETRRLDQISKLSVELTKKQARMRFIKLFLDNSKKMLDMTKSQLQDYLMDLEFTQEQIDNALQIRIYDITADMIPKLEDDIVLLETEKKILEEDNAKSIYIRELKKLLKEFKSESAD